MYRPGACSVSRCAPGQLGQQRPHLRRRQAGEAGRGGGGDVRAGVQAEQPEQPGRGRAQGAGRTRRTPPARRWPGRRRRQRVQAGRRRRAARRRGRAAGRSGWVAARAATMASASGSRAHAGDDLVDRVGLGGDPVGAEPAGQQLARLAGGEQVEGQRVGALGGDQAGELVAAGDQRPGSRARRAAAGGPGRRRGRCPARPASAGRPAGCGTGAACASRSAGIRCGGTPSASRKPRTASAGSITAPPGSKPRRLTYSCPSGNRSATRCAQCTARAVLPTPAVPPITVTAAARERSAGCWLWLASRLLQVLLPTDEHRRVGRQRLSDGCGGAAGDVLPSPAAWKKASRAEPASANASASSRTVACRGAAIRPTSILAIVR